MSSLSIGSKTLSKTFFVVFLAQVSNQTEFNLNIYVVTSKVLSKISFTGPELGFIFVGEQFCRNQKDCEVILNEVNLVANEVRFSTEIFG